jgi:hypothetical protein
MDIILLPILPNLPKRLDLHKPNSTYIFGKSPIVTYIVGGYLFDLYTYVGLCSLHRYSTFS